MTTPDYLVLDSGRQLHFRRAGSGPVVVLLHPSPLSSAFMQPLIDFLSGDFDVIAPDTPGYGCSDPLAEPSEDLSGYVRVMGEMLAKLELGPVTLYGNATGAQLAIESAKQFPQRVSALVLENAACFSDAERTAMLERYFPDLTPSPDGAHLDRVWQIARQLYVYFPWYDAREEARFSTQAPPLELVQATALAYLQAGPDYARAYRAAFNNERPEQLAAVQQPTNILLWADAMLLAYSRRLQSAGLPDNIVFTEVPGGIEARYGAIAAALAATQESL